MDFVEYKEDGIILKIKVIPNSSINNIVVENNILKLKITAPPVDNKANKFIISYLSKFFKIPKSNIKILKGELSKDKKLLLNIENDIKRKFIEDKLSSILDNSCK